MKCLATQSQHLQKYGKPFSSHKSENWLLGSIFLCVKYNCTTFHWHYCTLKIGHVFMYMPIYRVFEKYLLIYTVLWVMGKYCSNTPHFFIIFWKHQNRDLPQTAFTSLSTTTTLLLWPPLFSVFSKIKKSSTKNGRAHIWWDS